MSYSVVWFKRDLRLHDNEALFSALEQGPVICLYILEPSYWAGRDTSRRQLDFLKESLLDLAKDLKSLNLNLTLMNGEAIDVFSKIYASSPLSAVHSYQESGNAITFKRDILVKKWLKSKNVRWSEYRQHGVLRGLTSRNQWNQQWDRLMNAPQFRVSTCAVDINLQNHLHSLFPSERWPLVDEWSINQDRCPGRQLGGRVEALKILSSFLTDRSTTYVGGISSPLKATTACSRLSPYLSLGCLSMREVVQATNATIQSPLTKPYQSRGLHNFLSRLHWHCHFIQKLESEPEIEWRNMNQGFNGLRENEWSDEHFERLISAQTGWPLVDACVVMLRDTGWLNFRMRAMLISIASYPLWLHWKKVGDWLATQFVDYEPGIHWSQVQMQSGTTGINTTRVYNPIKQAMDHDPRGEFVRRWLPVLRRVPDAWIFEPWTMPESVQTECGVFIGRDWPVPVVDLAQATREAKNRMHTRKSVSSVKEINPKVLERHGSRANTNLKRINKRSITKSVKKEEGNQLALDF
jgi:deoxyribodipyrimidine photo-lyase